MTEHLDKSRLPHVTLTDGAQCLKRIAFLAEVRNRALKPLEDPTSSAYSVRFDKLLYLNDINFNPIDAANLLFSTNIGKDGRTQYRAACAVDFINPFKFYDTFATRDLEGYSMGLPFYPWFTSSGRADSRQDVLNQRDAVRVRSCWGGMVAFEAKWFQTDAYNDIETTNASVEHSLAAIASQEETAPTSSHLDSAHKKSSTLAMSTPTSIDYHPEVDANMNWGLANPVALGSIPVTSTSKHVAQEGNLNWHLATSTPNPTELSTRSGLKQAPLRFRAEADTYWDSSECCLIHADLQDTRDDISASTGIYMNPYIRVAYDQQTLNWLAFTRRFERLYSIIHGILTPLVGLPGDNPRRTEEPGQTVSDRIWLHDDVDWMNTGNFSGRYQDVERIALPGGFCGGKKLLAIRETGDRLDGPSFYGENPPEDVQ